MDTVNFNQPVSKPSSFYSWRLLQIIVWCIGFVIFLSLFLFPSVGIDLFWNLLIPVAPLLFVLAVGVWRNVCPMAITTLLPRQFNWSQKRKLTTRQIGNFQLTGVILLYLLVMLRHTIFNLNGPATGLLIGVMILLGFLLNFIFDWKSAWCSGLCPIFPVEKMYGYHTVASPINAHCDLCVKCVKPCPDTTANFHPTVTKKWTAQNLSNFLIVGGLPGFIWGWFQVADRSLVPGWIEILEDLKFPLMGLLVSLTLYGLLRWILKESKHPLMNKVYAAAAVSFYYWFRIPALVGYGRFGQDGQLIDLSALLPKWIVFSIVVVISLLLFYWLVVKKQSKKSWVTRPAFA